MKGFMYALSLVCVLLPLSCSNPTSEEPADVGSTAGIRGEITTDMYRDGAFYIPVDNALSVSQVYVRWAVGSFTNPNGELEYIWTYWQSTNYQLGNKQVVISVNNYLITTAKMKSRFQI